MMNISIVDKFKEKTILVVGDIMLDKYVYGETTRISPEAPVPVVKIMRDEFILGGAANVANNVASLKGNVILAGVIGKDKDGEILKKLLKQKNINSILFEDEERPTIVKERIISGNNYQLLRLDYEKTSIIDEKIQKKMFDEIKLNIKKIDVILLSDYSKGVLSDKLSKSLIKLGKENKIPVIVDGKPENSEWYKNCTLITPNLKEATAMSNVDQDIIEKRRRVTITNWPTGPALRIMFVMDNCTRFFLLKS